MAVPKFHIFMRPTLECLDASAKPQHINDIVAYCVARFNISPEDQQELLPSGKQTILRNRVHWAVSYLRQAKCVVPQGRGVSEITERGRNLLKTASEIITKADLDQFPEFVAFDSPKNGNTTAVNSTSPIPVIDATPEEKIGAAYGELNATLAQDLLEEVKKMTPAFFERLVVELMLRLGYGSSVADAGKTLGRTGDGGVDGVINQDKLGIDKIFLQAKRWTDASVGRKEVQAFVGSLVGQHATKGVFIATSTFTKEARDFARAPQGFRIILIDGNELSQLMIEHNLGLSISHRYEVKRIDTDYFVDN